LNGAGLDSDVKALPSLTSNEYRVTMAVED